jgi:prepilin-type N-terminal cleavage/methylation domain-containing protein
MKPPRREPLCRKAGFTLIEVLVSVALLAILLLIVTSLFSQTLSVSAVSNHRISADSGARQALDRLGADFSHALIRSDLPARIEKQPGNDGIAFHAASEGYTGDRGISRVGYRIQDDSGQLERGAQGLFWDGPAARKLELGGANFGDIDDGASYEVLGKDIFRFELAFLLSDGTIVTEVSALRPDSNSLQPVAVIVGIAVVDPALRQLTGENLAQLYPDALPGEDVLTLWGRELHTAGFGGAIPPRVLAGIRIYQRFFPLR